MVRAVGSGSLPHSGGGGAVNTEKMTPTLFASSRDGSLGVFAGTGHCLAVSASETNTTGPYPALRKYEIPSKSRAGGFV